jgi:hypothetical protein
MLSGTKTVKEHLFFGHDEYHNPYIEQLKLSFSKNQK